MELKNTASLFVNVFFSVSGYDIGELERTLFQNFSNKNTKKRNLRMRYCKLKNLKGISENCFPFCKRFFSVSGHDIGELERTFFQKISNKNTKMGNLRMIKS